MQGVARTHNHLAAGDRCPAREPVPMDHPACRGWSHLAVTGSRRSHSGGVALHGTYWHNRFGTGARLSHGCINLPLRAAAWLYDWAPMGTTVKVTY